MTSGITALAAASGLGLWAMLPDIKLAPTARRAQPQPSMNHPRVRLPLAGSITMATFGFSVDSQVARMDLMTYGSLTPWPRNGPGSMGPRGQPVRLETTDSRESRLPPMCREPAGFLPLGATPTGICGYSV